MSEIATECRIQMTSHLMSWFDKLWCQSGSCTLKSWATIRWTSPSLAPLPFPEWHSTGWHITVKISHDSQLLVLKRSRWIRILGNLFKITKITVTQYPLSAVFGLVIVTHHDKCSDWFVLKLLGSFGKDNTMSRWLLLTGETFERFLDWFDVIICGDVCSLNFAHKFGKLVGNF